MQIRFTSLHLILHTPPSLATSLDPTEWISMHCCMQPQFSLCLLASYTNLDLIGVLFTATHVTLTFSKSLTRAMLPTPIILFMSFHPLAYCYELSVCWFGTSLKSPERCMPAILTDSTERERESQSEWETGTCKYASHLFLWRHRVPVTKINFQKSSTQQSIYSNPTENATVNDVQKQKSQESSSVRLDSPLLPSW